MVTEVNIEDEILRLKAELEFLARKVGYDFQHPEVIALSQKLDKLIIQVMKK